MEKYKQFKSLLEAIEVRSVCGQCYDRSRLSLSHLMSAGDGQSLSVSLIDVHRHPCKCLSILY